MKIKIIICFMLAAFHCCFGQVDTNVFAVGDWSEIATNAPSFRSHLRGRLILYQPEERKSGQGWPLTRVYLELQNVQTRIAAPIEIHWDSYMSCLRFEMRDGHDQLIVDEYPEGRTRTYGITGQSEPLFSSILPSDSTLRLRVDEKSRAIDHPDGLVIADSEHGWIIPSNTTNDYYLSATFTQPTRPFTTNGIRFSQEWSGTLQLPKMRIPIEKIQKR